jgi:hypothetical protein
VPDAKKQKGDNHDAEKQNGESKDGESLRCGRAGRELSRLAAAASDLADGRPLNASCDRRNAHQTVALPISLAAHQCDLWLFPEGVLQYQLSQLETSRFHELVAAEHPREVHCLTPRKRDWLSD